MSQSKTDFARIQSVLESMYEIESYVRDASHEDFLNNSMMRIATVKQLEIIGAITEQVSDRLKDDYPQIHWEAIERLHKVLVHEYLGINYELVWVTANREIPVLKKQFELILSQIG
ncbi:DUF86 domain-containing protein [Bernardetia sp.]|uniref:HepT-like ribonuclease domain-containing protein n=1 Tax=Bernardetia sp. TaxID=1937974 RepID=UPI0025BDF430|nr:HepT-like ribonuclease domain-containing protein [Bernardetia sp.]